MSINNEVKRFTNKVDLKSIEIEKHVVDFSINTLNDILTEKNGKTVTLKASWETDKDDNAGETYEAIFLIE